MPTLYVEGVPEGIYEALRARAKQERTSISAEVLKLLAEGVPTEQELARRRAIVEQLKQQRARRAPAKSSKSSSSEELLRKDRGR
jgi:plasmid stability protein